MYSDCMGVSLCFEIVIYDRFRFKIELQIALSWARLGNMMRVT